MSLYERAVKNWKTTVSGLLTIVLVVTGAMATQQISLGHIGAGTVVAFIAALAKGAMAVISKDPQ